MNEMAGRNEMAIVRTGMIFAFAPRRSPRILCRLARYSVKMAPRTGIRSPS